jgi:hypothetical protein
MAFVSRLRNRLPTILSVRTRKEDSDSEEIKEKINTIPKEIHAKINIEKPTTVRHSFNHSPVFSKKNNAAPSPQS